MSMLGRLFGHAFGLFFMVLGAAFIVTASNDGWMDSLAANSTCNGGTCSEDGAATTFMIIGVSFVATGLISSVVTEVAVRKTRSIFRRVTTAQTDGTFDTVEGISSFLEPFGIKVDPSVAGNVNVEQRTFDLRGQRAGREVPTDPAGLSEYLKSVGVHIDEAALRNATVVEDGEVLRAGTPVVAHETATMAPGGAETPSSDLRLERATIVRKKDRGATTGGQRLVEFELEVTPIGKVPYRVEVASLVRDSLAGLLIEGSTLNVRVDPGDDNNVTIDWSEN